MEKIERREKRHRRIRAKVKGTASCPRLSVFRSNKRMILQLIDDDKGKSLLQLNDSNLKARKKLTKTEKAFSLSKKMAELAKKQNIKRIVFDRGGYKYHGRIKAVAEGAREGGLKF